MTIDTQAIPQKDLDAAMEEFVNTTSYNATGDNKPLPPEDDPDE